MTDSLINYFSGSEIETTSASKKDQQFSILSKNKYQFERYLLEETNSIELDQDAVSSNSNITSNNNEPENVVTNNRYLNQFSTENHKTEFSDLRDTNVIKPQLIISNNYGYKSIQQIHKLDIVLESMHQSKTNQVMNIDFNREIKTVTNKFIDQEQLDPEYFRIVKDKSLYKLYLNIDEMSVSIDQIKHLVMSIENKRNIMFKKVYINREVILDRSINNTVNDESTHIENTTLSINYKI